MPTISIGTKFRKQVGSAYVDCVVTDIYDITSVSRATGQSVSRVEYFAKSDNYHQGSSFEVAKTTILRGLVL